MCKKQNINMLKAEGTNEHHKLAILALKSHKPRAKRDASKMILPNKQPKCYK
jgi:hypothetical protein